MKAQVTQSELRWLLGITTGGTYTTAMLMIIYILNLVV